MTTADAERKAQQNARKAAERQRRADAGLQRLELYAHPEDWPAIKELAEKLQRKRDKAARKTAKG